MEIDVRGGISSGDEGGTGDFGFTAEGLHVLISFLEGIIEEPV